MENAEVAIRTLHELKAMGIHLSIDDFGTGYSSLAYLKRFPIDALKVDQSFVRDITSDPDDAAIASAIIAMGHSLRLTIIAEGVETPEQLGFLRERELPQGAGLSCLRGRCRWSRLRRIWTSSFGTSSPRRESGDGEA